MADVTVRVKAEPEFAEAEAEARSSFGRIESDARASAEGIEEPFERAADEVGGSFDRVEGQVRGSLDGLEVVADRAADGIADPFERAASDIEGGFDGVDTGLRRSFDRAEAAATSAAGGIESEFETAADRIPASFDGLRSKVGSTFDGLETDASSAARGIGDRLGDVDLSSLGTTVTSQASSILGSGGPLAGIAVGGGALVAGDFIEGFDAGFGRNKSNIQVAIRTGLDEVDVGEAGVIAGEAYSDGFGEGLGNLKFEVAAVGRELEGLNFGDTELQVNKELQLLQNQLGVELPQSVDIATRALGTGLASSVSEVTDGLVILKQELPLNADEAVDAIGEYSATFGGLNVQMEQFIGLQVAVQKSGQFENISQGNEAIRELNTRLTETDELRGVFANMGLDVDRLRAQLVSGDLVGVLQSIEQAVSEIDDEGRRRELLGQIFGTSVEDSTDRLAALQALIQGLTTDFDDYAGAADRATEAQERSRSSIDRLKSDVVDLGTDFGGVVSGALGQWQAFWDEYDDVMGGVVGSNDDASGSVVKLGTDVEKTSGIVSSGGRSLDDFRDSAEGAADGIGETEEAVAGLVDELDSLLNFSADQLMRNIADAGDDLAEALEGADTNLVGLNGEIRTGTEEGRDLQAAFEDLAEQQLRAADAYASSEITATEYRIASAQVRAELDRVTEGSRLTQAQIDGLAAKYGLLPEDVETIIRARDEASDTLGAIRAAILGLPTSRTITVTTLRRASAGPNSPFRNTSSSTSRRSNEIGGFAEGGIADGPALVGEEGFEIARRGGKTGLVGLGGPEIRDFQGPTEIIPHDESFRLLVSRLPKFADGTSGFRNQVAAIERDLGQGRNQVDLEEALRTVLSEIERGPAVNIENWNVTDGRDSFQDLRNLESVYRMSA